MNNSAVINSATAGIASYKLILNLNEALREKIEKVRQEIRNENYFSIPNSKANIMLASFSAWQMKEEKLLDHLKKIAMAMPPFMVSLNDYGSFPSHSVYINVTSKVPLQLLTRQLRQARNLMKTPLSEPYFPAYFNIPVASKLKPGEYNRIWAEFSHRHFSGQFVAHQALLLKKKTSKSAFEIAAAFDFMNLPVSVRQGDLFS